MDEHLKPRTCLWKTGSLVTAAGSVASMKRGPPIALSPASYAHGFGLLGGRIGGC